MAKISGKKIRKEVQGTSRPLAKKYTRKLQNKKATPGIPHASVGNSANNRAVAPLVNHSGAATQKTDKFSGFIFMCNGKSKPECYVNRVFGLPAGKKDVVEKIKPGTKLFLFDFDVKLLYGVYEASSMGGMNLEPAAFGGMYPAQVKFRIHMDCLPLPMSSFRTAMEENFKGSKFAPELNGQQVRNLLALFRPIAGPSSASLPPSVPNPAPNPAPNLRMALPSCNAQLNSLLTPPLQNPYRPYPAGEVHSLPQPVIRPHCVQQNGLNPHLQNLHPAPGHLPPPAPSTSYQFAENRPPYLFHDLPQTLQEPYPRFTTKHEVYSHDQTFGSDGGHNNGLATQRALQPVLNHTDRYQYPNAYPMPTPSYDSSHVQTPPPYGGPSYIHHPHPPPPRGPQVAEGSVALSSLYSFAGPVPIQR